MEKTILDYYKKWSCGHSNKQEEFVDMLWTKATFTSQQNKPVYAFDGLKDKLEMRQMAQAGEKLLIEGRLV